MPRRPVVTDPTTIPDLLDSFALSLRAASRSPRTVTLHVGGARRFAEWLGASGYATVAADVAPDDVRRYLLARADAGSAGNTVSTERAAIRAFFQWALAEGIVATDPTDRVRPPKVEQAVVPVLSDDDLRKLFAACSGTTFADRRDLAILRLALDTGVRRAELLGLRVEDVDVARRVAVVVRGKGGRGRVVAFGDRTATAMDRYLRMRRTHRAAASPALWLGRSNPMTYGSLRDAIAVRATKAGVPLHLHQLRHTWVSRFLAAGGTEGGAMALGGWRSARMLQTVYATATRADRAVEEAHRIALGDRL